MTIFALDYRGYGLSKGTPKQAGIMSDAQVRRPRQSEVCGGGAPSAARRPAGALAASPSPNACRAPPRPPVLPPASAPAPARARAAPQAALDTLLARQDVATGRVALFGRSLGGAVAIHLAAANEGKVRA